MANITINEKKRKVEVSKAFAKAASRYGTDEYKILQEVRKDYPTFRIETRKTEKRAVS